MEGQNVGVKQCRHGRLMYYHGDQYIGRSLDLYGEFSEIESDIFAALLKPGMVAIDVGANIGVHTLRMARAVGRQGVVHAFEPQREIFYMLCGNLALNECSQVRAHHAALGVEPGSITVPILDYTAGGNFGGLALGGYASGEAVQVATIDGLGLVACHFIKVDVEGMEKDVLAGAVKVLKAFKPLLYVENDREEKSPELIDFLFGQGYRLYWHLTPLFNPNNFAGNAENAFANTISVNMLGIHRSIDAEVPFREIMSPTDSWKARRTSDIQPISAGRVEAGEV